MSDLNISDILGKGFKFTQSVEPTQILSPVGTVGAYIGCADWGPVGVATRIEGGRQRFQTIFGSEPKHPEALVDFGYYAMLYHFRNSSVGYFTRIANELSPESFAKAKATLTTGDTNGVAVGSVAHSSASGIDTNEGGDLTVTVGLPEGGTQAVVIPIPASISPEIPSKVPFAPVVIGALDELNLEVIENGGAPVTETITIPAATYSDLDVLQDAINTALGASSLNGIIEAVGGTTEGFISLIMSDPASSGTNSSIEVTSVTGGFVSVFDAQVSEGQNVSKTAIASAINLEMNDTLNTNNLIFARFNANDRLEITNVLVRGSNSTVAITGSTIATTLLGTPTITAGATGTTIAEIVAKYEGRLGNTITIDTVGVVGDNRMDIYFDGGLIGSVVNFSYNPSQANYIGKLINEDIFLQPYVTYEQVTLNYALEFPNGFTFQASGGRSGGLNVFPSGSEFDGEDEVYPSESYVRSKIEEYSNIENYDIDYICYPAGGVSYGVREAVQDTVQEVCESRQDCFGLIDPPFVTSISEAVNWANGLGGFSRTNALNSPYLITAFPWLKIRVRDQILNVPPSLRVGGVIANADRIAGTKFSAPAGTTRGIMREVEGLTVALKSQDKTRLYADVYNGRINPISFSAAVGFYFDGNKTCQSDDNSLRRINTMRVGLFLKKQIQQIVDVYFYQPSDAKTWESFTKDVRAIMSVLEEQRAIEPESDPDNGWRVICDASINTPEITNKNGMVAKIEYVGIKSIERIGVFTNIREKRVTIQVV